MAAEDDVIPVAVRAWIAFAAFLNLGPWGLGGVKSRSIDFEQSLNRRLQRNDFYSFCEKLRFCLFHFLKSPCYPRKSPF